MVGDVDCIIGLGVLMLKWVDVVEVVIKVVKDLGGGLVIIMDVDIFLIFVLNMDGVWFDCVVVEIKKVLLEVFILYVILLIIEDGEVQIFEFSVILSLEGLV